MARARVERSPQGRSLVISPQPSPPPARPADATAMLDLIECLLHDHGWCQGRPRDRAGRLSLDGAVDAAAATLGRSERERTVLAARTRNHLTHAAGAGALAAWNDRPGRQMDDITELIVLARFIGV